MSNFYWLIVYTMSGAINPITFVSALAVFIIKSEKFKIEAFIILFSLNLLIAFLASQAFNTSSTINTLQAVFGFMLWWCIFYIISNIRKRRMESKQQESDNK